MGVPSFNQDSPADSLPQEVFRWLCDASTYVRSTPNSAAEAYDVLKLVLRLLAVRNPESQSHATRRALGSLITAIYEQPDSESVCLDLLGLLIRMVDARREYRYNPMKHLAIAGLGHLSQHMRYSMRQMTANVFVICTESLKIMPTDYETKRYRNTLIWALEQSAVDSVDEATAKQASKLVRGIIETADGFEIDATGVERGFNMLSALLSISTGKPLGRKLDSLYTLTNKFGLASAYSEVRHAAARCYGAALLNHSTRGFRLELEGAVALTLKALSPRDAYEVRQLHRVDGLVYLLEYMLEKQPGGPTLAVEFNEWMAALLLQLDVTISHRLVITVLLRHKLVSERARLDALGVLLRLLGSAVHAPDAPRQKVKTKQISSQKPQITSTLHCLSGIASELGGAVLPVADPIHQVSLGLVLNNMGSNITGPAILSEVVQCIVVVVRNSPSLLMPTIQLCLKQLEAEGAPARQRQALAYVLSTMIAEGRHFPLYGDVDLNAQVLHIGARLVKSREDFGNYSVAWTLFSGIMALGPTLVRPLLPQFLLMWESHLSPDACRWQPFVERALTALVAFMAHNRVLLTADVSKRIGRILHGVWTAVESHPSDLALRRRLLQSYDLLLQVEHSDVYPSSLLMKYIAHISSPANYSKEVGVEVQSAMVSVPARAGTPSGGASGSGAQVGDYKVIYEPRIATEYGLADAGQATRAFSHDIDSFLIRVSPEEPLPLDIHTAVVDTAISVASRLLPLQPHRIQESVLDSILVNAENTVATNRSPRQYAITYNIARLIKQTLSVQVTAEDREINVVIAIVKHLVRNNDPNVRQLAAESAGLLAKAIESTSAQLLTSLVKELLESIVKNNNDASARSGEILALGFVAGVRSQPALLEAMYKVLMPLAADPTAEVHLAVLESLRHTLTTSKLVEQRFVKSVLKVVSLNFLLESHNNSRLFEMEVARCLAALVSSLGPDLSTPGQETSLRTLARLADQIKDSTSAEVRAVAWKSFIELYYYARHGVNWMLIIHRWRDIAVNQNSEAVEIQAMINGLLMLMRLSARSIFTIAGSGLEEALWLLLDRHPHSKPLRLLFATWMEQTSRDAQGTALWIHRLQAVVMRPRYYFTQRLDAVLRPKRQEQAASKDGNPDTINTPNAVAADEDVSLGVQVDDSSTEQFVWEARVFALELLLSLLRIDLAPKEPEDRARSSTTRSVSDIVKIAFSAATSQVLPMQYTGLALLNELILLLGDQKDPDFPQISLLEQFQMQILSALSPAFGKESSPGLALAALQTCGTFMSSNVIKAKDKLARLIKILSDSLDSIVSGAAFRLGSVELGPDAAAVLRMAVLRVWAQIDIHSADKPHLREIIQPVRDKIVPLWIDILREHGTYASTGEDEWSSTSLLLSVDQVKASQRKLLLIPVHKSSRMDIINALATPVREARAGDADADADADAVDGNGSLVTNDTDLMAILYGLCFEALMESLSISPSSSPSSRSIKRSALTPVSASSSDQSDYAAIDAFLNKSQVNSRLYILQTLEKILVPQVTTRALHGFEGIFEETLATLYRTMLLGSPEEQTAVVSIARSLATGQIENDESVDSLIEILKVAMLPLRNLFPQLFDSSAPHRTANKLTHEQLDLLRYTLDALIDIAQVFREVIQTDLWICLLKIFEEVNHYQAGVAAVSFKRLLEILAVQVKHRDVAFIVDALTFSLKRAVDVESTSESLLISTAIVCTNYDSLSGAKALQEVVRFGARAASATMALIEADEPTELQLKEALTASNCINAVLTVCADSKVGEAFAYACLPAMVVLSGSASKAGPVLPKGASEALTTFAMAQGTVEALAFVIPSLLRLESDEGWLTPGQRKSYTCGKLLQLVTRHTPQFKQTVQSMNPDDRSVLQGLLVSSSQEYNDEDYSDDGEDDDEGEITLKSFV